jgi:Protein of unknown function (DUF4231)
MAASAPPGTGDVPASLGEWSYTRLESVIDELDDMADNRKQWMKNRWLEQTCWFDKKGVQTRRRYSALRVTAIIGGVLVPPLVSIDSADNLRWFGLSAQQLAFFVSLLVAASVALEGFFHFGDRWLQYRRTAELLKIEGWLFLQSGGRTYSSYRDKPSFHDSAFHIFADRVERLIGSDVQVYLTEIAQPQPEDGEAKQ